MMTGARTEELDASSMPDVRCRMSSISNPELDVFSE